jgi:methyl-accepting chemotaxis protein
MARSAEEVNRMTAETDVAVQSATATVANLRTLSTGLHELVSHFRI